MFLYRIYTCVYVQLTVTWIYVRSWKSQDLADPTYRRLIYYLCGLAYERKNIRERKRENERENIY